MNYTEEIIRFIRRNRVSTTEVADALGKSGVLHGLSPMSPDLFKVGPARCVFTANESNYALHDQIKIVQEGEVVVVFEHGCGDRALLGDIISKFILLYRGAEALVVNALVRDASRLKREHYAVWAKGATPLGCFNKIADPFPPDLEKQIRQQVDGGVAVCDDGGVVVIPQYQLNQSTLERLHRIELQEDIWNFCLNTLKWDTKKIVCDKDYLKQPELLPSSYQEKLGELEVPLDGKK